MMNEFCSGFLCHVSIPRAGLFSSASGYADSPIRRIGTPLWSPVRHEIKGNSETCLARKFFNAILATIALWGFAQVTKAQSPLPDDFNPGANSWVNAAVIQLDGKILVGGNFTNLAGQVRNHIGRLNTDGTLDTSFNPNANADILSLAIQPDGKILMVGSFTNLAGQVRNRIARLNTDGTLDSGFDPNANGYIRTMVLQADGKILVGGGFTTVGGQSRNYIARLNADGTPDSAFNPGASSSGPPCSLYVLTLQEDGKILVGGTFTTLGGQPRSNIGRLNADGTIDSTFNPGANNNPVALAIQPDGKILVGGWFTTLAGQPHRYIGRLNADGTLDVAFNPSASNLVYSLSVQADGKILVGGNFTRIAGQLRSYIARFNEDGALDGAFDPGANGAVCSLIAQADGKILVVGGFTTLGGQARICIGRLNITGPATQDLSYDGSAITWLRGGTSPEVWRTTFEITTNGASWSLLGAGSRTNGGWKLSGVSVTGVTIRARGFVTSGEYNGSGNIVESILGLGAPLVVGQPMGRTNNAGTIASFGFNVGGAEPSCYQWRKDGVILIDGGNISGATNAALFVSDVLRSDEGGYDAVYSNEYGTVTSLVATLSVVDPAVNVSPQSQVGHLGETVTLSAVGGGTGANYQWNKDGTALSGQTNLALVLTDLQSSDAGNYDLTISGTYGSVTSSTAVVSINQAPLDTSFGADADNIVYTLALQVDGKILAGGRFLTLNGQPRQQIGRLNTDGTLDMDFNPGASADVYSLVIQNDGKILVGGNGFSILAGLACNGLGRLNSDGTRDLGFTSAVGGQIQTLAVQPDGKILVSLNYFARLNTDGSIDATFTQSMDAFVNDIAIQPDGKILVGGSFKTFGGQVRNYIARLNANGTIDLAFNPGANGTVYSLNLQSDGKILVGGFFTTLAGQACNYVGRLNADGSLDETFNASASGPVNSLAVQADSKILVGGSFATRQGIARLNADGTMDATFNPGANNSVYPVALQADGDIVAGGLFTVLAGHSCNRIGRLHNTSVATQSMDYAGSTLTWLRGGTAPEVWRTTFECTTNGTSWSFMGAGSRTNGGWCLGGVSAADVTIRARGYSYGGWHNSAGGIVQTTIGTPVIVSQPASRTNSAGTIATFSVGLAGSGSFTYQWRKDGVNLTDGGNISGVTNTSMNISGVLRSDEGGYDIICSNVFGIVNSTVATLTVIDPAVNVSPVSQIGVLGGSVLFSVGAAGTGQLTYQWRKNGVVLAGETNNSLSLADLQASDAGNYDAIVTGTYGSATSTPALLTLNLVSLDTIFNPSVNMSFYALAVQPDRKILLGGQFTNLGGQGRNRIGRLNADGTLDLTFNPDADSIVISIAVQPDGKILTGGTFTNLGGQVRNRIGRINADGTLDASFDPGANNTVEVLVVQPDGQILVGGQFTTLAGQSRNRLARLNADGTLDATFNPSVPGEYVAVYSLAVQPDGKILVGGAFTNIAGQVRNRIARLNADGAIDAAFNPDAGGDYTSVQALSVQADGKILMGGTFRTVAGQERWYIARLNSDGTVDSTFNPGANQGVATFALQADGKILVGGNFTLMGGQVRYRLARLNADGTPDATFAPDCSDRITALAIQTDGNVLLGGNFTALLGQTRNYIARLNNSTTAPESLSLGGTTLTWLRSGSSPEVWRTTFEHTTDGTSWTFLGAGSRIGGGWELSGVSVEGGTLRARGYTASGEDNASGGIVESTIGEPVIVSQPCSRTNNAGTAAAFAVEMAGSGPFTYQWRKAGLDLFDGGTRSGVTNATLYISNVFRCDEGGYDVVIGHSTGSVTSTIATLTVVDPAIYIAPTAQRVEQGGTASLNVAAGGTGPLSYQWWKDGVIVPQATNATLMLTGLQGVDAGNYEVTVSGAYGCVTSAIATLTVNLASLDSGFTAQANGGAVSALAMEADGRIVVGGAFTNLADQARNYISRLNPDGTLDTGFNPGANSNVNALVAQSDGGIVVGGEFVALGGQPRDRLARLNADGTLDAGFNPGANNWVYALAEQTDGKLLVGGGFTLIAGQSRIALARLNANGTLDAGFNPGANNTIAALAIQSDGQFIAGGNFTSLAGQARNRIGRMNTNGMIDASFNPDANDSVRAVALQPDGKILVGGCFTNLAGQSRNYIGRLNSDGTIDAGFNPDANDWVHSIVVQTDGKILVSGWFTMLAGQIRNRIARLNADGSLDLTFDPDASSGVYALALQADGKILAGGVFATMNGQIHNYLARLNNTGAATQDLRYDEPVLAWLRGGTGPEVWRTTFEYSTNETAWILLGAGSRTNGGWALEGVAVTGGMIRARGYAASGIRNGSAGIMETTQLVIEAQLTTLTVNSTYGGAYPVTSTTHWGTVISCDMINSPVTVGGTQYVANGATVLGNDVLQVGATNVTLALTNNATLTWLWNTNYWLNTIAGPNGMVNVGGGWQAVGVTTQITATADAYYHFSGWTGSVSGPSNPLEIQMNSPQSVQANFAANLAASNTPEWWLANNGWFSNYDEVATNDDEPDGFPTWQEYIADTDPRDSNSFPRVGVVVTEGSVPVITWFASTGRLYQIHLCDDLVEGAWTIHELSLGTSEWADTNPPPTTNRYYRIAPLLP